jgi:hypothetical protein
VVIYNNFLPQGDGPVIKKLSLVVALVLMAGSAMADDLGSIDLKGISDANNSVVEASLDVDVDTLAAKTSKNDEAVEACFRGWGHYNYGCYNYCYNYYPCYSYNYCYTPCYHTYYVYRPVVYTSFCHYPLYTWGCY